MPDWLAHVLFAYVLCKILSTKSKTFTPANTAIVIVGALVPDIVKINMIINLLGIEVWDFIAALHTPIGSLLLAGLISLLFHESFTMFWLIVFGATTHYILDVLMIRLTGGLILFYPLNWKGYQLGLMQTDNSSISIILLIISIMISQRLSRNMTKTYC